PEHYPVVGKYLLAAIKEVLGAAATDEILQAWSEAYGMIADAFIGVEQAMVEETKAQVGGWEGFRPFVVESKVKESEVITSLYLVPRDGGAIAAFEPGQYVSIKTDVQEDGFTHIRQFSLSDAPGKPYYRISVKREDANKDRPAGKVSVMLHQSFQEGDVLWLSAPAGDFTLDREDRRPVVLISGGVGLTPLISMLNTLVHHDPQRQVTFIHAALNGDVHAMKEHVSELARRHPQLTVHYCYRQPTERDRESQDYHREGAIDLPWLKSVIPTMDAGFYFCGPQPFMKVVNQALTACGVGADDR
ncbi:nitric oxide dioxygenase, partial [Paenibacillus sepulcri]|nr:nitric oxide dioxygenase [Paenibacillus sepulcri]